MSIIRDEKKAKRQKTCTEEDDDGSTSIDVLNDDCLLQIFSYLPLDDRSRIERVCKRWQSLNSKAWNNFEHLHLGMNTILTQRPINIYEQSINDKSIEKILSRCGRFLITMTIHSFELACMYVLPSIANHCRNLTRLDLCLDTYPEEDLANVFANCKKLKYLKLNDLDPSFTGDCLVNLSVDVIEEMYLIATGRAEMHRVGAECIKKMVKLQKLELQQFKLGAGVVELIADNHTINDLSLLYCHLKGGDHIMNMRGLKNLDLYNTTMKISQQTLNYLEKNFPAMQCQDLYQNSYRVRS